MRVRTRVKTFHLLSLNYPSNLSSVFLGAQSILESNLGLVKLDDQQGP